ncbi:MAG: hypothetical protein AAGB22_03980 [Bacteroidota bacterium]
MALHLMKHWSSNPAILPARLNGHLYRTRTWKNTFRMIVKLPMILQRMENVPALLTVDL